MGRIRVDYEELHRMAAVWSDAASEVAHQAWRVQTTMLDGDVLASGVFDPLGAAYCEGALAAAVDGPHGMLALAVELKRDASLLRLTVLKEQLADAFPGLDVFGQAGLTWLAPFTEPIAAATGLAVDTDPLFLSRVGRAWGSLDDGPGYAAVTSDPGVSWSREPARSLADLVGRVGDLEARRPSPVAIQSVLGADGVRRWIVELPGMQSFADTATPLDLHGAVVSEFHVRSAYTRSVVAAMHRAGVPAGASVMLVGHSEGGIAAADLASDPAVNGGYVTITHVLAVGSPISRKRAVGGTRVFTVENVNDIVTHLDQYDSARRQVSKSWLAYEFSDDAGTVAENHDVRRYARHLRGLSGSPNPLLREFTDSASGYFGGSAATAFVAIADRAPTN